MKVLLTGGGTGGHVYPAIAIAEALGDDFSLAPLDLLFAGTRGGLEATIVPRAGYRLAFVAAAPLQRRLGLGFVRTVFANLAGFFQSLVVLHRFRPDVVIATGGYVAFPVLAATRYVRFFRLSRARIALLEPNAEPGLTNRLAAPLADETWLAAAPSERALRPNEIVTGTPVRRALLAEESPQDARLALGLDPALATVVIFGGSQGANRINEAVAGLAETGIPDGVQVILSAGERGFEATAARVGAARDGARVKIVRYLDDPSSAYRAADLVVARAGASTIGELAASGTPALLVPYPFATGDHQTKNARAVVAAGAARIAPDGELDAQRLHSELTAALEPQTLAALRASARALAARDPRAAIVARVKRWIPENGKRP